MKHIRPLSAHVAGTAGHELLGDLFGRDLDWVTSEAVCAQTTPDPWHPDTGQHNQVALAKAMCHRCPLEGPCLEYAVTHELRFGVWGGQSERERRRLIAERRSAA